MLRSLTHYWRVNLALLAAVVVTSAVLTGALIVGDSVRQSLRRLVLDRLGQVESVLVMERFVDESLALRLGASLTFQEHSISAVPVSFLPGSARHPGTERRASGVKIYGVDGRFERLFSSRLDLERGERQIFPTAVINSSLARDIGARVGDQIVFHLMGASDAAAESLVGDRDVASVLKTIRAVVRQVVENEGVGQFEIHPSQTLGLNAYLPLEVVQEALGVENRVNLILFSRASEDLPVEQVSAAVEEALTAEDYGFRFRAGSDYFVIESSRFVLKPFEVAAVERVARNLKMKSQSALTHLANRLSIGERSVPYSTVTAIAPVNQQPLPELQLADGRPVPPIKADQIYLNEWAARELAAEAGDLVTVTYYEVGPRDELLTRTVELRAAEPVAMRGMGADSLLTPEYPGIHEAEDMARWDPPFPVDLDQIRPQDEDYWDRFRATPKAFLSLDRGRELWSSRFGDTTSVRLSAAWKVAPAQSMARFQAALGEEMTLESGGFQVRPLRREGLAAARGPTDFSGLFGGFSFFLIAAALLLVGLLFRLAVEGRAAEIGILSAVGYTRAGILRRLLWEVSPVLVVGALFGLGLALVYSWAMLAGLGTFWNEAVGTTLLAVSVSGPSLLSGFVGTLASAFLALWLAVRKLVRLSPARLLSGHVEEGSGSSGRWSLLIGRVSLVLVLLLLAVLFLFGSRLEKLAPLLFFVLGFLVLSATLSYFSARCRGLGQRPLAPGGRFSWLSLALRNVGRNPGRSLVSVLLIALASFTILAVEASRTGLSGDLGKQNSPTGGFELLGRTSVPILQDLNSGGGRFDLGIDDSDGELARAHFYPFRLRPGDDTSCLNLYQPQRPRILGVPGDFRSRGGFEFQQLGNDLSTREKDNPWLTLERDLGPGVVPAFGDYESVRWILKLGLGEDLVIADETGSPVRLRLVGLLHSSIFQSEILIAESAFNRLFPGRAGYSYFLVDTGTASADQIAQRLESSLGDHGFDVVATRDHLAGYLAIRNTYISTFQTLGGLGLILGTLGLGVVLLRNVLERRRELAVMRAFGFSRRRLSQMVVAENLWLLIVGLLCGTLAATIALLPSLWGRPDQPPWMSLLFTLVLVLIVGTTACVAAVTASLKTPLLPSLKGE